MAEAVTRVSRGAGELSNRVQGARRDVTQLEQELRRIAPDIADATRKVEELRTHLAGGGELTQTSFSEFRDTAQYLQQSAQARLAQVNTPQAAEAAAALQKYVQGLDAELTRARGASSAGDARRAEAGRAVGLESLSDRDLERAQREAARGLERADRDIRRVVGDQTGAAADKLRRSLEEADPQRRALVDRQASIEAEMQRRRSAAPAEGAPDALTPEELEEHRARGMTDEQLGRARRLRPGTIIVQPAESYRSPGLDAAEAIARGLSPLAPAERRAEPARGPREPQTADDVRRDADAVAETVDDQAQSYERLSDRQRLATLSAKGFRTEWDELTRALRIQERELGTAQGQFERLGHLRQGGIQLGPREQFAYDRLPSRIQDLEQGLAALHRDRETLEAEAERRGLEVAGDRLRERPQVATGGGGGGRAVAGAFLSGAGFGGGSVGGTLAGAALGWLNPWTAAASLAGLGVGFALSDSGSYVDSQRATFDAAMRLGGPGDLRAAAEAGLDGPAHLRYRDTIQNRVAFHGRRDLDDVPELGRAYGLPPEAVSGSIARIGRLGVLPGARAAARTVEISVPRAESPRVPIERRPRPSTEAPPVDEEAMRRTALQGLDVNADLLRQYVMSDSGPAEYPSSLEIGATGVRPGALGELRTAGRALPAHSLDPTTVLGSRQVRTGGMAGTLAGAYQSSVYGSLPDYRSDARMEEFLEQSARLYGMQGEGAPLRDFALVPTLLSTATRAMRTGAEDELAPDFAADRVGAYMKTVAAPQGDVASGIALRAVLELGRRMSPEEREEFRRATDVANGGIAIGGLDITNYTDAEAAQRNVFALPPQQRDQIQRALIEGRQRVTGKGTAAELEYLSGQIGNPLIAHDVQRMQQQLLEARPGSAAAVDLQQKIQEKIDAAEKEASPFLQDISKEELAIRLEQPFKDAGQRVKALLFDLADAVTEGVAYWDTNVGPLATGSNMSVMR